MPQADHGELPPKEAARACFVAAEEMQNRGQAAQAISLYEKARSNDPSLKSIAHRLAVLYDAQGDSARSLAEYNKALESDPKNASLLSDLGYYYYERGNHAEAERRLRQAMAIEPSHAKALCNLGLVLAAQGRLEESFQAFSKAVGPAAAHSNLGVLLAKQGRYDEARQAFPPGPRTGRYPAAAQGILSLSRQAAACSLKSLGQRREVQRRPMANDVVERALQFAVAPGSSGRCNWSGRTRSSFPR